MSLLEQFRKLQRFEKKIDGQGYVLLLLLSIVFPNFNAIELFQCRHKTSELVVLPRVAVQMSTSDNFHDYYK